MQYLGWGESCFWGLRSHARCRSPAWGLAVVRHVSQSVDVTRMPDGRQRWMEVRQKKKLGEENARLSESENTWAIIEKDTAIALPRRANALPSPRTYLQRAMQVNILGQHHANLRIQRQHSPRFNHALFMPRDSFLIYARGSRFWGGLLIWAPHTVVCARTCSYLLHPFVKSELPNSQVVAPSVLPTFLPVGTMARNRKK